MPVIFVYICMLLSFILFVFGDAMILKFSHLEQKKRLIIKNALASNIFAIATVIFILELLDVVGVF